MPNFLKEFRNALFWINTVEVRGLKRKCQITSNSAKFLFDPGWSARPFDLSAPEWRFSSPTLGHLIFTLDHCQNSTPWHCRLIPKFSYEKMDTKLGARKTEELNNFRFSKAIFRRFWPEIFRSRRKLASFVFIGYFLILKVKQSFLVLWLKKMNF